MRLRDEESEPLDYAAEFGSRPPGRLVLADRQTECAGVSPGGPVADGMRTDTQTKTLDGTAGLVGPLPTGRDLDEHGHGERIERILNVSAPSLPRRTLHDAGGLPHESWPFGHYSCVFGCGHHLCVENSDVMPCVLSPGMLTERQLAVLRASPPTGRVATAIFLAGVTQLTVAEAIAVTQAYVSDVARRRYSTITVASARKFARFFGCSIDPLFAPRDERGDCPIGYGQVPLQVAATRLYGPRLEPAHVRTYIELAMPNNPDSREAPTSGRTASLSTGSSAEPRGVSPASSGPAGAHFEAQVGAAYLLALLTDGEPRGLPGMAIDRIELQRATEGRPLDDVIVHAHDGSGTTAVLEIQVKREIAFSPADRVFRDVVQQIAAAARRADFWTSRYELAVATAKTSAKISGPYQDVLTWARQLGSAMTFIERINRPGSANDNMRTFVRTFRRHLQEAGAPHSDETVWGLLRRFQILVHDFTAPGSADESRARDRASLALHPDDAAHAATLWTELVELAVCGAAAGGDRTRSALLEHFRGRPFRLAGERRHTSARRRLAEASDNALADIDDTVGGAVLFRHERVAEIRAALDAGRYVEIRGNSGVGKSGLLKHFARQVSAESRVIVLSPVRTTPRGWSHMCAVIGFDGTAQELLADFAQSGGAILFIDNLNRFTEDERLTVIDLVRAASTVPGVSVVATARTGFGGDETNWLPAEALQRLVRANPITIGEFTDAEIGQLRDSAPQLAALLADGHPAQQVARNLFRLSRLATCGAADSQRTEIDMARQWWDTADGPDDGRRERACVVRAVAKGVLAGAGTVNVDGLPPAAVDALVRSESLRDFGSDRVAFRHDVLAEWAVSSLLSDLNVLDRLPLQRPAPAILARSVELAARSAIERSSDSVAWQGLLEHVSRERVHGSWRRAALLALVRSEATDAAALKRASEALLENHARLLRELIRTVQAVHVRPASQLFAALGVDPAVVPPHLNTAHGPAWPRLIMWLVALGDRLPTAAIPDVVRLYSDWSLPLLGRDPLTPLLLPWLHQWLSAIEDARDPESTPPYHPPFAGHLDGGNLGDLEDDLRTGFVTVCDRTPALAASYLKAVVGRRRNERAVEAILKFRGRLAEAAPAQLAAFTAAALIPPPRDQDGRPRRRVRRRDDEPFTWTDRHFFPPSPAQGPFLELLTHAPQHGLPLIRQLVDHMIAFYTEGDAHGSNAFVVAFSNGPRTFRWVQSYYWSREGAARSFALHSALMALEAWAHKRIEAGEAFETVLADVLGPGDAPAAYLLVAVDLILSHWPESRHAGCTVSRMPRTTRHRPRAILARPYDYPGRSWPGLSSA